MSFQQAQQNRQAILDHLHAHPSKSALQLAEAIGITRNSVQSAVKFMTDRGEVSKTGKGKSVSYTAVAITTISAEQVVKEMQAKKSSVESKKIRIAQGKFQKPGVYRQIGGGWDSLPAQGGQGACPRPWGIQSGLA